MKLVEIKELNSSEMTEQVIKSRVELTQLRMKFASRQLEDPSLIKKKRKEIARLLTIQTQKLNGKDSGLKVQEEKRESKEASKQITKKTKKEETSEKVKKVESVKSEVEKLEKEKKSKDQKKEKKGFFERFGKKGK